MGTFGSKVERVQLVICSTVFLVMYLHKKISK